MEMFTLKNVLRRGYCHSSHKKNPIVFWPDGAKAHYKKCVSRVHSAVRGNPEEGKRAGGRETVDESPDREEDREENLGPGLR